MSCLVSSYRLVQERKTPNDDDDGYDDDDDERRERCRETAKILASTALRKHAALLETPREFFTRRVGWRRK